MIHAEVEREQHARVAESLRLAAEARDGLNSEPETALLISWEALLTDRNEVTESTFRAAVDNSPAPTTVLRGPVAEGYSSSGFAGQAGLPWGLNRTGDLQVWEPDGAVHGRATLPKGEAVRSELEPAAAGVPGADALIAVHGRTVQLLSLDGETTFSLDLGPGAERTRKFGSNLEINGRGRCAILCRDVVFVVDGAREGALRLLTTVPVSGNLEEAFADRGHVNAPHKCRISPDGRQLLTQDLNSTIVWRDGRFSAYLRPPSGSFMDCASYRTISSPQERAQAAPTCGTAASPSSLRSPERAISGCSASRRTDAGSPRRRATAAS